MKIEPTGTLDVTDDRTALVVHELNANLGDTTARACIPGLAKFVHDGSGLYIGVSSKNRTGTAEDSRDLHELNGGFGGIHGERMVDLRCSRVNVGRMAISRGWNQTSRSIALLGDPGENSCVRFGRAW